MRIKVEYFYRLILQAQLGVEYLKDISLFKLVNFQTDTIILLNTIDKEYDTNYAECFESVCKNVYQCFSNDISRQAKEIINWIISIVSDIDIDESISTYLERCFDLPEVYNKNTDNK